MIPPAEARPRDERTIVVALGGNALQPEGAGGDIHEQFRHTRESLGAVVDLAGKGWRIAIVHGNGPQIGDELLRNEFARSAMPPLPLGVLVAATAGWIGYMIQQSLQNALARARIERCVATLITQVIVDPAAADDEPTKPIGRVMDEATAQALARELGWSVGETGGGWRRLVPSPVPTGIVEARQIRQLVFDDIIVIAAGGGGTPVYHDAVLRLEGVDAVVDKDRAAEVLGREIGASVLLILTNVEGAYRSFGSPQQQLIAQLRVEEASALLAAGEFGSGSMGPKVEAAVSFIRGGGSHAIIARLDQGLQAAQGEAGTTIVP
ncbi:MAG TPA: carbamate kinase [Longimicrobiales bacterium]|nr:carbamate kinase [Longimicrobiales bacterium]